jgi:hypothetical protein
MIRMTPERILCKDSSGNTTFDTNDLFLRQFSAGELVVGGTNIGTPIFYGLTNLGPFNIGGGWMSETFGGSSYASGFSDWNYFLANGNISSEYIAGNVSIKLPAGEVTLISWHSINRQGDGIFGNSYYKISNWDIPDPPGAQQWVSSTRYLYPEGLVGAPISYRWRFWRDTEFFNNAYFIRLEPINATCTTTSSGYIDIPTYSVTNAGIPYGYTGLPGFNGWYGKFNLSFLVSRPPINLTAEVTV